MILAQRDLISAQSAEIQARVNWAKAVVALQGSMGTFLESHNVSVENALRGDLWRDATQPSPPADEELLFGGCAETE